jgi:hypothetical protein
VRGLAALLVCAALACACGARTDVGGAASGTSSNDAGASFPVGTYSTCAFGTVAPSGPFLIPSGFDASASLQVARSGDTLTATYADGGGRTYVWSFAETTSVSATLAPSPQTTAGFGQGICVYGVGVSNEKFFPTELEATAGAMTYESGTVFVSLGGALSSTMDCGDVSAPAAAWVTCGGGPAPAIDAPTSAAQLAAGDYACTSQLGTHTKIGATESYVTSGGNGTLSLTQTGAHLTATYGGDAEVTGTIDLTVSTASVALGSAGQTLTALCGIGPDTGELPVTASTLTVEGGTVFLSFAGTTSASSSCPGTQVTGTLVCTKM